MKLLSRLLFGSTEFSDSEEYLEFKFKFMCVLMFMGGVVGILFLLMNWLGLTPVGQYHLFALGLFFTLSFVLWVLLRGRKQWFLPLAWCFEAAMMCISLAAWVLVPQDELRVLWLFVNLPAVFLIFGQRAGLAASALTILTLVLGNLFLQTPYSSHALITLIASMVCLTVLLHTESARSMSYFARMQDYNERLLRLSLSDPLTDVLNARAFNEASTQKLAQAQRTGTSNAVLFIDLDHFKSINDNYGHLAGDFVLKAVAKCLQDKVRKIDLVGRLGGEEFCVFLPHTSEQGAMTLAENLRIAIEALLPQVTSDVPGKPIQHLKVTASIGVTTSTNWRESMQVIQQRADVAMYTAKQQGRNRISLLSV